MSKDILRQIKPYLDEDFYVKEIEPIGDKIKAAFPKEQYDIIASAFVYAAKWHSGAKRDSGEPYILHPVQVAEIVYNIGLDYQSICAALLHDVLEDTDAGKDEMTDLFGKEIVEMVEGLTKIKKTDIGKDGLNPTDLNQAENFRKLLMATAGDIRVVLIKLSDRLHNMRTLGSLSRERQQRISKETLYYFAPLAERLGIMQIKGELEDLSFKYLFPEDYKKIKEKADEKFSSWQNSLKNTEEKLKSVLDQQKLVYSISSRRKHLYSIYKKMKKNKCSFDDVYDFVAVRIILDLNEDEKEPVSPEALEAFKIVSEHDRPKKDEKEHEIKPLPEETRKLAKQVEIAAEKDENKRKIRCYEVIGTIHSIWAPLPGRIKDYISTPKANHYSSLHTTVLADGNPIEIQVRTVEMHQVAEYGIAAHWKYKDGETNAEFDKKLEWFRKTVDEEKEDKPAELLDALKQNLFAEDVFVFTPNGKVIHLPVNSTVIDFAYAVHSEVGNQLSGALVNDKFVPITTVLHNGDIVKVQTLGKHPSIDWLRYVKSSGARSKIKQYFKKANREEHVRHGKELLEAECKRRRYQLKDLATEERIKEIMEKNTLASEDDLYAALGSGTLKAENVVNFFITRFTEQLKTELPLQTQPHTQKQESGILINGEANLLVRRAKCCKPIPGDEIVGYISRGRGITVHRRDCEAAKGSEVDRFINAEWGSEQKGLFGSDLVIKAKDRTGLTADICAKIYAAKNVTLTEITARVDRQEATVFITVNVESLDRLLEIKRDISQIKGVSQVERINGKR